MKGAQRIYYRLLFPSFFSSRKYFSLWDAYRWLYDIHETMLLSWKVNFCLLVAAYSENPFIVLRVLYVSSPWSHGSRRLKFEMVKIWTFFGIEFTENELIIIPTYKAKWKIKSTIWHFPSSLSLTLFRHNEFDIFFPLPSRVNNVLVVVLVVIANKRGSTKNKVFCGFHYF